MPDDARDPERRRRGRSARRAARLHGPIVHLPTLVRRVVGLVERSEYKRRQSAPGPKITTKSLGRERRRPITSGWNLP